MHIMQVDTNIKYANDNERNYCDVYYDSNKKNRPVCIIVHGGAWIFGTKSDMVDISSFLHEKANCVCLAPNYTLSCLDHNLIQQVILLELICIGLMFTLFKKITIRYILAAIAIFIMVYSIVHMMSMDTNLDTKTHPDHVMDIARCIEWTYKSINQYGGDPNKIFLMGHSAGGHLVSLVTLNKRFLTVPITCIKGVISLSGPYSFFRIQDSLVRWILNASVFNDSANDLNEEHLLSLPDKCQDQKCQDNYQRWAKIIDAWPIFHQHQITNNTPPFFLLTSGVDLSLILHAHDFADMLKQSNVHTQLAHYEYATHFSIRKHWDNEHAQIGKDILTFIQLLSG